MPDIAHTPLAFRFSKPAPPAATYAQNTKEFRYWTAAEALRRGADFWAVVVPLTAWELGKTLPVLLDEGQDLNAYYDRKALNFFHGPSPSGTVYSGESPDVICHEMGHAILDSFKPQLWGAASQEVAAFHESFGDMSAILSALQLQSLRSDILSTTGGKLAQASRLSRLAEQLGAAIRAQMPDAVEVDCLRNAANSFTYRVPSSLPSSGPASQLSSEPHSFSRVFTGAFFEILGAMLQIKAGASPPTEAMLLAVSNEMGSILAIAIKAASVVSDWYAQVAAQMVLASKSADEDYPSALKAVFVRRQILSLHSSTTLSLVASAPAAMAESMAAVPGTLPQIALKAEHYGLEGLLFVDAPGQHRAFIAAAASNNAQPIAAPTGADAAQHFVDDLFTRGRVEYRPTVHTVLDHQKRLKTHRVVSSGGNHRLERILFDCGLCDH
ncbi:hypothetical protein KZX46_02715 (plasmid) [Polymorphobacter sp. PAMC 29334]|uniref:hypothetical protein n=1 Tax=Polymorphobacter sp. PAMC 29334 TaxID=2862331 RepID=UPI001C762916|nr:hypothetical protein [Polymorphobacter sp. PAMC 29334]QYE33058.1 hypothetical protein KZX46_02715 [Polymorphobacter sp. PAMC 29334]